MSNLLTEGEVSYISPASIRAIAYTYINLPAFNFDFIKKKSKRRESRSLTAIHSLQHFRKHMEMNSATSHQQGIRSLI